MSALALRNVVRKWLVRPAGDMPERNSIANAWSFEACAGRMIELSGFGDSAVLSMAMGLVLDAQHCGETVAWITSDASSFFPPDMDDSGVDLDAVSVVRISHGQLHPKRSLAWAAERLARSGAFGLIVVDLDSAGDLPPALLGRLMSHAGKFRSVVLFLSAKSESAASLGPTVAVRAHATRRPSGDRFLCGIRILKERGRAPGGEHAELLHGPAGLR